MMVIIMVMDEETKILFTYVSYLELGDKLKSGWLAAGNKPHHPRGGQQEVHRLRVQTQGDPVLVH